MENIVYVDFLSVEFLLFSVLWIFLASVVNFMLLDLIEVNKET